MGDDMKTIHKFAVDPVFELSLEPRAQILSVQTQKDMPQMWVLLDPDSKEEKIVREFRVFGTGHPMCLTAHSFIGTFQLDSGLVFHLFEDLSKGATNE